MVDHPALEASTARIEAIADEERLPLVAAVSVEGEVIASVERGRADRRCAIPNTLDTVFGVASVTKGVTALVVASLIEDGQLGFEAPVRTVLGDDLPLIDDAVTIDHLLTHRSGIGDYLDEEQLDDDNAYVLSVPVHRLASTEAYLEVLEGYPQVDPPGHRFAYNNSGYVVLALVAERVAGQPFADLATDRVLGPAGMTRSGFHRSDELPAEAAIGYLELSGFRTNGLHLPVLGGGDGGLFTTVGDLDRLWRAVFGGRIVPPGLVDLLVERVTRPASGDHYGRGFWLVPDSPACALVGGDAGISVRSVHHPRTGVTATVVSNTTAGAWPVAGVVSEIATGLVSRRP